MSDVLALRTSPGTLREDIDRAFGHAALGGLDPSRATWIKVNGNFNLEYPGSNTSPWFLRALLGVMTDRGFRSLTVVEGDLPEFRAEDMARSTRLLEVLAPFSVPFASYERLPRDEHDLPAGLADVQLLNTPVFHTHGQAVISCATKNLFGLLPVDRRKHHRHLNAKLLELHQRVPCATIVDGTVGLEGESTRRGDPVRCDLLLAGSDTLSIDVVAAHAMGFAPGQVPLLEDATARGRVAPPSVTLSGDFSHVADVPSTRFRLEIGTVRRIALWLNTLDVDLEPLLKASDPVRVLWHRINRRRKRRSFEDGAWRDYLTISAN